MLSGGMYDSQDKELVRGRDRAHVLAQRLEALPADDHVGRERLTREMLGAAGPNVYLEKGFQCEYGDSIHVGANFYCNYNYNCLMIDCNTISIGDDTMIGPNVTICTATHPGKAAERCNREGHEYALPIWIGNQVWIGAGAIINPGVTIGEGAVMLLAPLSREMFRPTPWWPEFRLSRRSISTTGSDLLLDLVPACAAESPPDTTIAMESTRGLGEKGSGE